MTINDLSSEHRDSILAGLSPSVSGPELRSVARGLRQPISEVARRSGLRYDRAERILNGRANALPDELAAIARALGLPSHIGA